MQFVYGGKTESWTLTIQNMTPPIIREYDVALAKWIETTFLFHRRHHDGSIAIGAGVAVLGRSGSYRRSVLRALTAQMTFLLTVVALLHTRLGAVARQMFRLVTVVTLHIVNACALDAALTRAPRPPPLCFECEVDTGRWWLNWSLTSKIRKNDVWSLFWNIYLIPIVSINRFQNKIVHT